MMTLLGADPGVGPEDVEGELGALEFVLEMGMDEELVGAGGEVDVHFQDADFVAGVLVEADFADAQDARAVEELGMSEITSSASRVSSDLGVDAEPAVVGNAVPGGPLRLVLGELAEVVEKAQSRTAVEARPEGGFADGGTAGRWPWRRSRRWSG